LVVPGLLAAPYVLSLLYGETAGDPVPVTLFRALLLAFPLTTLYLLNGHALYAVGQQRRVTVAMVLVTVANGALNALAIPRWGYWGAVGTAFTSEALLYVSLQAIANRYVLRDGGEERA
jgi:O-antigen/teichoic acid export membrane protein